MENYRGFEEDFTEESQEVHLGRWNCFVTDHYWKIKIFKDQSFEMEFYNKFDSVMNFSGEILKKKQNSQEKIGIPYKISTNNFVLMLSLKEKNQASAQIFKNQYQPVVYIDNIECYK